MSAYNKVNNISGWIAFAIATIVFVITIEPTASFWDAGEFIASSYKLQVPHPPGAPFFLLVGRLFSLFASDVTKVAFWVNMVSVVSSGFTVLFLFWTITLLGRKMLGVRKGEETKYQTVALMGAGFIGSLAFAFSDSFWFSAVEAEVYAMSSFFSAFVFWAILKWETLENERRANQWLILIAYMIGLSIGVHLLNLLAIPSIALVYYFKKHRPTKWGIIGAMGISGVIVLLIMIGIIPGLPSLAGSLEIFFVNSLGLPFGSGMIFFAILFLGSVIYGIWYSIKHEKVILNTIFLCFTFIIIGYSSYAIVTIRSNFNPPIDENNPENLISFVSYLKREQYGSRPLLHGPYFTAELIEQKQGAPIYEKGKDKYVIADHKVVPVYDPKQTTILPRIYSNQGGHPSIYREILNLKPNENPNFFHNIKFLLSHQIGHMYMRYFMWNFSGKESDQQDADWLAPWNTKKGLPDVLANNKARNNFLMLPLILGIAGLAFQYSKDAKGFSVVALLFLLGGVGLILYLNQPPVEPRERDYTYVGSFYAFAIWIGFGVLALSEALKKVIKNETLNPLAATIICLLVPGIMAAEGWDDHDRSNRYFSVDSARNFLASVAPNAILFTGGDNDTFPLWYVQEVEGFRTDVRVIVLSYFNTDWYVNQMKRQVYKSKPLPFSLDSAQYKQGGPNDYVPYIENPNLKGGAIDLRQYIDLIKKDYPMLQRQTSFGGTINTIPSKNMVLTVDKANVAAKDILPEGKKEMIADRMVFSMKGDVLYKSDVAILDLIVTNNWERPIYFNNTSMSGVNIEVSPYVVQEGATYRLLPIADTTESRTQVNLDVMYNNLMNNFYWRELDNPDVFYNEDYKNFVSNHRSYFNDLGEALLESGDTERAKQVLLKSFEVMPDKAIPYDYLNAIAAALLAKTGEVKKATEVAEIISNRADEMLNYMLTQKRSFGNERQRQLMSLKVLSDGFKDAGQNELASKYQELFMKHYGMMNQWK